MGRFTGWLWLYSHFSSNERARGGRGAGSVLCCLLPHHTQGQVLSRGMVMRVSALLRRRVRFVKQLKQQQATPASTPKPAAPQIRQQSAIEAPRPARFGFYFLLFFLVVVDGVKNLNDCYLAHTVIRLGLGASIKPATASETIKAKIGGKLHRAAQKHKNDAAESSDDSSSGKSRRDLDTAVMMWVCRIKGISINVESFMQSLSLMIAVSHVIV